MALVNCSHCKDKVDVNGGLPGGLRIRKLESATWDWFNIEMLPMEVGPCRGCHEVKTDVLTKLLNLLVLLDVLYPRPDWDKEKSRKVRWKFR